MQILTSDRLAELKQSKDLTTDIVYSVVNWKKEITSLTYTSEDLKVSATETFTYDLDNNVIKIQLS